MATAWRLASMALAGLLLTAACARMDGAEPFAGTAVVEAAPADSAPVSRFEDDVYALTEFTDSRGRMVYPTSDGRIFFAEAQRRGYLRLERERRRRLEAGAQDTLDRSLKKDRVAAQRADANLAAERRRVEGELRRAQTQRRLARERQLSEFETDALGRPIEADGEANRRLLRQDFIATRQERIRAGRQIGELARQNRRAQRLAASRDSAATSAERLRLRADRALQRQDRRGRRLGIGAPRVLRIE